MIDAVKGSSPLTEHVELAAAVWMVGGKKYLISCKGLRQTNLGISSFEVTNPMAQHKRHNSWKHLIVIATP
jgi:hypothetical protein